MVERMLQLDRLEEAVGEAEKAEDYSIVSLADIFVRHGHGLFAEQLIQNRTETSGDIRLTEWLKDYAIQEGNLSKALILAKNQFWLRPILTDYLEMNRLAIQIDQWTELRSETIDKLSKTNQFGLLVEIFLEEGEIDLALEVLEEAKATAHHQWEYPYSLERRLAKVAEKSRPERAIQLYLNQIKGLIDKRGRDNYAEAADYLKVVQKIYKRIGRQEDWQSLITSLHQENRMLPAFQDELKKAGY